MFQLLAPTEASGAAMPPRPAVGGTQVGSPPVRHSVDRLSAARFSELYQAHHRALWCIAAAIVRDRDLAYDVVQEAAMVALGKLDEFDAATSFPAWCGQIVRFLALNQLKKNRRSHTRPADPAVLGAALASPSRSVPGTMEGLFSSRLSAALDTLDETARACLLMRTVMDMSYKHIAEALGVPEGTAMSHVHRSRQALRTQLAQQSGDAPA